MSDRENERKLNPKGQNDGMMEGRKGVSLYASAILWRGHKNRSLFKVTMYNEFFRYANEKSFHK